VTDWPSIALIVRKDYGDSEKQELIMTWKGWRKWYGKRRFEVSPKGG